MAVDIYTHLLQLTKGDASLLLRNDVSTNRKRSARLNTPE